MLFRSANTQQKRKSAATPVEKGRKPVIAKVVQKVTTRPAQPTRTEDSKPSATSTKAAQEAPSRQPRKQQNRRKTHEDSLVELANR